VSVAHRSAEQSSPEIESPSGSQDLARRRRHAGRVSAPRSGSDRSRRPPERDDGDEDAPRVTRSVKATTPAGRRLGQSLRPARRAPLGWAGRTRTRPW
jgi:hypothetical protein